MERNTFCTASTPSSAATTSKPSRPSTEDTIRRRVGLSSAMTTVGMVTLSSSADETSYGLDELVLVELGLEQIGPGARLETGALVVLAPPRRHDDDGHVLPAASTPDRARQGEPVHPG